MSTATIDPVTADLNHEWAHRIARRRWTRQRWIERGCWLAAAGLLAAAVYTGVHAYLLGMAVAVLAPYAWRRAGAVDTPATREAEARRFEYIAYGARQYANTGTLPDTDDPLLEELCARQDVAEVGLPWWVRTDT